MYFTFTGKEQDSETGYGYFGARYMDHELMTMWLSVDPMADKHSNVSPYTYCYWNPIKLTDPNGCDSINGFKKCDVDYSIEKGIIQDFPYLSDVIYLWGHGLPDGNRVVNPLPQVNQGDIEYHITASEYAKLLPHLSTDYCIRRDENKESIIISNMCHSGREFSRTLSKLLGDAVVIGPCDVLSTGNRSFRQFFESETQPEKRKFSVNYKGVVVAYFWGFYNTNSIIEKYGGPENFIQVVHRWYDNYNKGGCPKSLYIE